MAVDQVALSLAVASLTSAVSAFYQMLPPISEVRKNSVGDPTFAADVRVGEVAASIIALGIGSIASSLSGSPAPAVVAAVMSLSLIALYEVTLRSDHPLERTA